MNSTPVICGIDLGSWSLKICAFNGQKLQVLTNEANFRETPSLVAYTPTQRLIGQAAMIKIKTNYNNTIRAPQRLLGLHRHGHLLQEELKYERVAFQAGKDLVFSVQGRQGKMDVTVEEVLISLIGKVRGIVEGHQLSLAVAYIAVPTYFGQEEREALKKCAELAFDKPVRLVDDWIALAAQYTYNRLKEIKVLDEMKHVVFLDIGYSKVSLSLVQFTRFEGRLLDWEYLPYTGCKNMDQNVCEFYSQLFEGQHKYSLLKNPKAFVKLLDAVQRQRTVLSANNQYHLNLEYLLNEQDLTYNMKRQELENIIVPVLADIAGAMAAIQSRNCSIPIHAVQLMGGASRIPCIQSMAAKIFGMEPSRGMNQSQAITVGSTIVGALQRKVLNLHYSYDCISTKDICVRWGKQKKTLFSKRSKATTETSLNIGNEGIVNMVVFVQLGVIEKQIGHLRFKSPNKITFTLDQNKIIDAKLSLHYFEVYDFRQKSAETWKQILRREEELSQMDMKMGLIYEMKNDYQSKFYNSKNRFEELRAFATKEEITDIEEHIRNAEHWIQVEHAKPVIGSQHDFQKYSKKNEEISLLKKNCEELQNRRKRVEGLRVGYDKLSEEICIALERNISDKAREKIVEVMNWGQDAYQRMQNSNWRGEQLTEEKLEDASARVRKAGGL